MRQQIWVPHPRDGFVFVARVGERNFRSQDHRVILSKAKDPLSPLPFFLSFPKGICCSTPHNPNLCLVILSTAKDPATLTRPDGHSTRRKLRAPSNPHPTRTPRLPIPQPGMSLTRKANLRSPANRPHPPVRLLPTRQHCIRLLPVRHGSLIAPLHQPRHRLLVRSGRHIPPHVLHPIPGRHRPVSPVPIRQKLPRQKPRSLPNLIQRPRRIQPKPRQKPQRPQPQPRQTYKCHRKCS
jgi:hypothetical protein